MFLEAVHGLPRVERAMRDNVPSKAADRGPVGLGAGRDNCVFCLRQDFAVRIARGAASLVLIGHEQC